MDTATLDAPPLNELIITTARETATLIQSDPRMAVVAYNKRMLIEQLTREVEQINDRILAARQERAIWMNALPDIAVRHANDNDWCEEFDRAMEAAGLPCNRRSTETVTVYGTITASIRVDADDLAEQYFTDYSASNWDTSGIRFEVELDDDLSIEVEDVNEGECACDQVDTSPDRSDLADISSAADSFDDQYPGADYTISISRCTNCD